MANTKKSLQYGDERRKWQEPFVEYMKSIVSHENFSGMPDAIDDEGQVRWNAPSNRPPGKWQDLRDRRLVWWSNKAKEIGIETKGEWISKVAKAIHPFKEKPCQTCGRVMSLKYVYPTRNTLRKINIILPEKDRFVFEDFLTIYEIIPQFIKKAGSPAYDILISIFSDLSVLEKSVETYIRYFSEHIVPQSPRGKLSPGAMSNAPDRLDGFHTYNLCCRSKQDTGRQTDNLRTYSDDRRAFEFWCEGDWAAANKLMTLAGEGVCSECGENRQMSADHIGPISLGFAHLPWFKAVCSPCNSSKGNRLTASDVAVLIEKEKQGVQVISFQTKQLWDKCKNNVKNDEDANKLSKLMRINQHYFLLVLKDIYDLGRPEILLSLLHPELAEESISFEDLDPGNLTYSRVIREKRADTYSKSKAARMVRIAFDALDDYGSKEKRNIHDVPDELVRDLRANLYEAIDTTVSNEDKSDANIGEELNAHLKNGLGAEERAALIEKIMNGGFNLKSDFKPFLLALQAYTSGIGDYLASNKF
jgi:Alw26I/Eco31I/Esp3I family type II restriction endonuclease